LFCSLKHIHTLLFQTVSHTYHRLWTSPFVVYVLLVIYVGLILKYVLGIVAINEDDDDDDDQVRAV